MSSEVSRSEPELESYLRLGLIGYPVSHSLSPAMHNAALAHCGIAGLYELLPVPKEGLADKIAELQRLGFAGFNVTIPHKEAVYNLCAERTLEARSVQVANTIKLFAGGRSGSMLAHNTDIEGFKNALLLFAGEGRSLLRVCLVGNGGAARAAVQALSMLKVQEIAVLGRSPENSQRFVDSFAPAAGAGEAASGSVDHEAGAGGSASGSVDYEAGAGGSASGPGSGGSVDGEAGAGACKVGSLRLHVLSPQTISSGEPLPFDLVINSTPIGQGANSEIPDWLVEVLKLIPAPCLFFDMVYSKNESATLLVDYCRKLGFEAEDGLEMLVQQAALAFEFWTGRSVPPSVMRQAARQAMSEQV